MQPAAVGGCRLHEQIAAGRGSGLSCREADGPGTRSKCFDLCICASTAVKTQMQQMQRVAVAAAVVAVAVGVSLLAFSFKMFNYARLSSRRLPSPPPPCSVHAVSSGATTCCSFIHSICQFCTRQTNPTAAPTPTPTPTPTPNPTLHRHRHRRRFPARVKRLSRRTCSIFTASSSYPDDDDHHYDDRLQHDAAAATTTTTSTTTATATNY